MPAWQPRAARPSRAIRQQPRADRTAQRRLDSTATGFAANAFAVALVGFTSPNTPLGWITPTALPGCDQLASQEAISLVMPQAGSAAYSFAIPNTTTSAGLILHHQFLQFEVGAQNQIASLSSSNGLSLTIGAF